jgi:hypothetical protein
MTITTADVPRVAAAGRLAGELLEVHGNLMLTLASDWSAGAKAANLDPDSRGNRYESCDDPTCMECPHAIPSDPTGEAVLHARKELHADMQQRLKRWLSDSQWIRDMAHVLAPIVPPSTMNEKDDRWCSNHLRVGLAEPRWRGEECRSCYDFRLLWKIHQPVSIMRDRSDGKRITEAMVKAALEADGLILTEVAGVTKAVRGARAGKANQNRKKAS